MATMNYSDAVSEALHRLQGVGFEHGPSFANHAPMAAEALARLGFADDVPAWVEQNLRQRRYLERPRPRWALSAEDQADWASALGDFSRVADWCGLFDRELAELPWSQVLTTWWPRLLPGMSGVLTHGVIRTAHAVRALAEASGDSRLQLGELAQGLGYWAARYSGPVPGETQPAAAGAAEPDRPAEPAAALAALDELIADSAGGYVRTAPSFPVPLIHTITGPAAVRLVCAHLPADQVWPAYLAAREINAVMWSYFGGMAEPAAVGGPPGPP